MPDAQTSRSRLGFLILAAVGLLTVLVLWPRVDLTVSGWFYKPGKGFFWHNWFLFDDLHFLSYIVPRLLGIAFLLLAALTALQRKPLLGIGAKAWLFLFLGLVLAPGLVANTILKDHWGRARPRDVIEFGGIAHFSPAYVPSHECRSNCSFVSGDGAFGFFLPAFGYVAPKRQSRRFFWGGMGLGALFSLARLAMGAHFLSDTVYAALFVQLTLALLHMAMFGWRETRYCWRGWIFFKENQ